MNKDDLFERAKDYIQTYIELKKLTLIQSVVKAVGGLVSALALAIVVFFFVVFLSVALGCYLGEVLGSMSSGFFIVTAFYLLLAIIVLLIRVNYIQNPVINALIKNIFKKGE